MKTKLYSTLLANLALLSVCIPTAGADDRDRYFNNGNSNGSHYSDFHGNGTRRLYDSGRNWQNGNPNNYSRRQSFYSGDNRTWNDSRRNHGTDNRWNWDQHSWNDQRNRLRSNWQRYNERISSAQQEQLNSQMRAQWLRYHNNSWTGASTWNQYSDPQFLDYLHNRNPSLLSTIRSYIGY